MVKPPADPPIGIATFAAAATPAADIFSMLLLMLPLTLLYIAAAIIAIVHDKFAAKRRARIAAQLDAELSSAQS